MRIYIITHKPFKKVTNSTIYSPLLVGAYKNCGMEGYLVDNDFEGNISNKNKSFCELTGMYWIWKQSKEEIVGLCHYRRYFCKYVYLLKKRSVLKEKDIKKILSEYDIILPRKGNHYNGYNARDFFGLKHDIDVWDKCKDIISDKYPSYLQDMEWFEEQRVGYCYNMCIMRKKLFNEYSEWLFSILFELEKVVDIEKYTDYNARMFGFVSERLINVWVHHRNLKVKEMSVYFSESPSVYQKVKCKVKKILN